MRRFEVDRTLKESLTFPDPTFAVEICTDDYSLLPAHTLNCHWHHELEFGLVTSGELDYYIGGACIRLREGDCVFINANTMHMATQPKGCRDARMIILAFSPSLLAGSMSSVMYQKYFQPILGKPIQGFVFPQQSDAGAEVAAGLRRIHTLNAQSLGFELRCLSQICEMWNATIAYMMENEPSVFEQRVDRQNEERAKTILFYIRAHFAEDITIDDIARHANVSRSECFRCFKRFTNKTPIEYINEYRLANAAKMLMETGYSITEICSACGFSNSSYFCKLFKEKYALSPAKYRKSFG